MKKRDLAEQVARAQGIHPGAAADRMDRAVNQIIRALRKGQSARLPGLGVIAPGKPWVLRRESGER
jgi:nucleoid DNA-binding protein